MFYDLPSPIKFAQDIYECLDDNGTAFRTELYAINAFMNISYDTIYYEHLEYYSLKTIKYIFDRVGFKIIQF